MKKIIGKLLPLGYGLYYNLFSLIAPKRIAEKAFTLFCTIRKGKILPHQKEYLDIAKHELEPIGEHKIQTYQWKGNKETVLLVHGWESNTFRWRNLVEKLQAADFNIIAFDAPGHGYSTGKMLYVPLYEESLQNLIEKYEPKYLVGHSVGGMTVMYNQHRNPNSDIKKIITIGSPSEFHELMAHYQNLLKFNSRVLKALDNYILNRFGFRIREFSTTEYAKANTKEGLLFHDRLDKITPYHASKNVHANWKGSKLISTEGLGHSMHQEEVNNQIIDFLKS